MKTFIEWKAKICELLSKNKKHFLVGIGVVVFFLFFVFGFFLYKNMSSGIFQVSGGNFDLGIKKIPYNVTSIDITFSKDILSSSITPDIFKIQPEVPGVLKLKYPNTLSYELVENLTLWQDYTVSISKNLLSVKKEPLENEVVYIISTVPAAKVLRVLPEETLTYLGKNLWVFFSIPMIPLTSLDAKDTLPCPIEITPKIEGKCSWTTTSVVEFIPKIAFAWATKYEYEVKYVSGMNYELEEIFTGSFLTPELQVSINSNFQPKNNILLHFNYPVEKEILEKNITFYSQDFSDKTNSKWVEKEFILTPVGLWENQFHLQPKNESFFYAANYRVDIKKWLPPKYGNRPLWNDFSQVLISESLISQISQYKNMYSQTGVLIDTKFISISENPYDYQYLPKKDVFFRIDFHEEMTLQKELFSFEEKNTGKKIDFTLAYFQEENEQKQIGDNKKSLKLQLSQELTPSTSYVLQVKKEANTNLLENIVYDFQTSHPLEVKRVEVIDYSKTCVYLNNTLDYDENVKPHFTFSNSWVLREVSFWEYIYDWQFERSLEWLSFEEKNKKLIAAWYCPEAKKWEYLYALQTRLKPNLDYTLVIENLRDKYTNILGKEVKKDFKTGNLHSKDKYVYTHFPNFFNVFPLSTPLVLNIQTINTSSVYADICEMSEDDYKNFLLSPYGNFTSCLKKTSKKLEVKNNFWNLTHNKFDLEIDILWYKTNAYFIGVEIFADESKSREFNYSKNILHKTNMSLFLEKASNTSILYATDIWNQSEISDLKLEFYDYDFQKTTVKYSFDTKKKVYVIDWDLSAISFITAKKENYYGVIGGDDFFSNYDFKYVSGMDSSQKHYAYVYSDRPIYRPGDEVFIKGLLREFHFDGFKKSSFSSGNLVLIDDNWEVYRTLEVNIDENSHFSGSFIIPSDSPVGNFRFEFRPKSGYEYIYTSWFFSIEEYRKPTFKVDIESGKNDVILGEKTKFTISPKYYFGGNLVNTTGKYSLLRQNYFFDAKQYADYQFGEWYGYFECVYWGYCHYNDHLVSGVTEFKIDENGQYTLEYDFWTATGVSQKVYTFSFDVVDPDTKRTVSNSISKVLHTTDAYVWLKASYYNSLKDGVTLDVVTLDFDAQPVGFKKVDVKVLKKDYKQVKKLWVDGIFYNEYGEEKTQESTFSLVTDTKWQARHIFKTKQSGEYEIQVLYTGSNGQTFFSSQIIYVAGDEYISWRNDNNTVTELEAEKMTYTLWETAQFTLKSPVNNGKALVVVEKDDGILDYFIHPITSYGDKIELKINENHYPNVYLKVFLIGNQKDNPLPVYKRALSVVKVVSEYKKLNVSLLTDKKYYKPGDTMQVTIEVLDAQGKVVPNANGSLSVVDESVLALKWNPRKNPYSFFYDMKRYLGTLSYSNLKYLVEKLEVKDVSDGEKWGAGDQVKWGDTKKLRGNFKDTAFWLSDFTTDKNGKAMISIPVMPDNLTTWVLEALVTTPIDNKIGITYETVMTTHPVMVEDNLPRFLSSWDQITFSPVVYNRTGKDDQFVVQFSASNGKLLSLSEKTIAIKDGASAKVEFLFQVHDTTDFQMYDVSQVQIIATSKSDANMFDGVKKHLPLYPSFIKEHTSTVWKTSQVSVEERIQIGNFQEQNAQLTVNYGGTLMSYLLDGIDYLNHYPYGCAEQRTSALMPNIYIKKLYDVVGVPFDLKTKMIKKYVDTSVWYTQISLDEAIQDYIVEIWKFQNTDGGFMYWYDSMYKYSDVELSSYIFSSLSHIASLGYQVPKNMMDTTKKYLQNEFYNTPLCSEQNTRKCLSLRTKINIIQAFYEHDSTQYETYKMYKVIQWEKISEKEKLLLLSKIAQISSLSEKEKQELETQGKNIAQNILASELIFTPRGAFLSSSHFSRLLNTAQFLESIANLWLHNDARYEAISENMIRFIVSSKMNNAFGSTYDTAFIIQSLTNYLKKTPELKNTSLFARMNFNGKEILTKKIDQSNIFQIFSSSFSSPLLLKNNTFQIEKTGTGTVYYDLNLSYFVPSKDIKARDEWFFVEKKYYSFADYKKIESLKNEEYEKYLNGEMRFEDIKYPREVVQYLIPITKGKVWELVLVYHKLVVSESRDQVAFESFIPSGSEIVNTNLATEDQTVQDVATDIMLDRKEFRDDRYFAWKESLEPWIYQFAYTIRLTHTGVYQVKPSQVSEFYKPEVFGRSKGEEFRVE